MLGKDRMWDLLYSKRYLFQSTRYPGQWGYQGYPPVPPGPMPTGPPPHHMAAAAPPMPVPAAASAPPPTGPGNSDYVPAAATAPPQPAAVAPAPVTTPPQQPLSATQSPSQPHISENPMTPPVGVPTSTAPTITPNGKKKPSKVVLIYNNNEISPVSLFFLERIKKRERESVCVCTRVYLMNTELLFYRKNNVLS